MADRHADLADLAPGLDVVAVVAGLRRQVEGNGKAGLPLGEILPIERIGVARGRMARVGAENPGFVALRSGFGHRLLARSSRPAELLCTAISVDANGQKVLG